MIAESASAASRSSASRISRTSSPTSTRPRASEASSAGEARPEAARPKSRSISAPPRSCAANLRRSAGRRTRASTRSSRRSIRSSSSKGAITAERSQRRPSAEPQRSMTSSNVRGPEPFLRLGAPSPGPASRSASARSVARSHCKCCAASNQRGGARCRNAAQVPGVLVPGPRAGARPCADTQAAPPWRTGRRGERPGRRPPAARHIARRARVRRHLDETRMPAFS